MDIPIKNIYYLLCYAWMHVKEAKALGVQAEACTSVENLLGKVLLAGTRRLLRRGMDRGYEQYEETTSQPRGRIDFNASLRQLTLPQAKAHCSYEILSHDVLHNRILKTVLLRLVATPSVDASLRHEINELVKRFYDVQTINLEGYCFRRVQLHHGNATYRLLMDVCELAYRSLLPVQNSGNYAFVDFTRDEAEMSALFERFVFNFYRVEQDIFEVRSDQFAWDVEPETEQAATFLPSMKTDISLRSEGRTIIVDTKYYRSALQERFGTKRLHSGNLYQIFAYLKNLERNGGPDESAQGILLYPTTTEHFDVKFRAGTHFLRAVTIDLAQDWSSIHNCLLSLLTT